MALLDKGNGLFESLTKLHADEHHRDASAAKGRNWQCLALQQALLGGYQAHIEKLVDEQVRRLCSDGVVLLQQLGLGGELRNEPSHLAVLDVVVAVLHVVAPQHLDFAHILVALPLQEVDLLEQLLLVELELAHRPRATI